MSLEGALVPATNSRGALRPVCANDQLWQASCSHFQGSIAQKGEELLSAAQRRGHTALVEALNEVAKQLSQLAPEHSDIMALAALQAAHAALSNCDGSPAALGRLETAARQLRAAAWQGSGCLVAPAAAALAVQLYPHVKKHAAGLEKRHTVHAPAQQQVWRNMASGLEQLIRKHGPIIAEVLVQASDARATAAPHMPNNELRAVRDQLEALLKSGSKDALFNYFTPSIDTEKTQFKALQTASRTLISFCTGQLGLHVEAANRVHLLDDPALIMPSALDTILGPGKLCIDTCFALLAEQGALASLSGGTVQDIAAAVRSVCQALLPLLVAVGETSWSANKHASQLEKAVQALHNDRSRLESSAIQARLDDIETMTKNTHAMLKALVDQRGLPSAGQ